ncbi:MAG: hypothetical protein LBE34_04085 [Flavobacteriaceae bacterium]|jgi:hypothetical protein|nr:hypothetical protein [Flavobacteriaceae bacterium]
MRKSYLLSLFIALFWLNMSEAQIIKRNIHDDLEYNNTYYTAKLKKDIHGGIQFTDSNSNKISYNKGYIAKELNEISNSDYEYAFFDDLVRKYRYTSQYEVSYKVDIFDKIIIEDNKGSKKIVGKDIHGNQFFEEEYNGVRRSIKRDLLGTLQYVNGSITASFRKGFMKNWEYRDSTGNQFDISSKTMDRLSIRFQNDEGVFFYLINEYLE